MSLEEFLKIKNRIIELNNNDLEKLSEDEAKLLYDEYSKLIDTLTDNDLSEIPFEEWADFPVYLLDETRDFDFSKTHANLDFEILDISFANKADIRGCNIKNFGYISDPDSYIVDESFRTAHPEYFELPPVDKSYQYYFSENNFPIWILNSHPEYIDYLLPKNFESDEYTNFSEYIIDYFGWNFFHKFLKENTEFYYNIESDISSDNFGIVHETLNEMDVPFNAPYEEALPMFYDFLCKYVSKGNVLSKLTEENVPDEVVEKYQDIFIGKELKDYFIISYSYYSGSLKLADLRKVYHLIKDKNLSRAFPNYSKTFLDNIDKYFNLYPPVMDKLIDSLSKYKLSNDYSFLDDIEGIKDLVPQLIDKTSSSFFYFVGDCIELYKFTGTIYGLDNIIGENEKKCGITFDILLEFYNKYPNLLDSYYDSKSFYNHVVNYLNENNIVISNTFEFENYFKFVVDNKLTSNDYLSVRTFVSAYKDDLALLLPERFVSSKDMEEWDNKYPNTNIFNIYYEAPSRLITSSLAGEFQAIRTIYTHYPDLFNYILPRLRIINFLGEDIYKNLYDKLGFDVFIKLLVNYFSVLEAVVSNVNKRNGLGFGKHTLVSLSDYPADISFILENINKDNYEDLFNNYIDEHMELSLKYDFLKFPDSFKNTHKELYLSEDAPDDLKEKFYSNKFSFSDFFNHPEWRKFLDNIDYSYRFAHTDISSKKADGAVFESLVRFISYKELTDILFLYGHIISSSPDLFLHFTSLEDFKERFYIQLTHALLDSNFSAKDISVNLNDKLSNIYLPDNAPDDLKEKFYKRELTTYDFVTHPEYFDYFNNTILGLGFKSEFAWIANLYFEDNLKQYKVLSVAEKINDSVLVAYLKDYLTNNKDTFDVNKINVFEELLSRMSYSNSTEIYNFRGAIASQLVNLDDPMSSFNEIENIFLRNNIPTLGKSFNVFNILHPNFAGFDFNGNISPELKSRSNSSRKIIIFTDLIKCAAGSNNRSLRNYVDTLKKGNAIYENIITGKISLDNLTSSELSILESFYKNLQVLYMNTLAGSKNNLVFGFDMIQNITKIKSKLSTNGDLNYNLADRILDMFAHFAGFDSIDKIQNYMDSIIKENDKKHRDSISDNFVTLHKGDFVKGLGDIRYLGKILQNGSVAREFLGADAGSDWTPLDTDVSLISKDCKISNGLDDTAAGNYGPIWIILRGDDRFNISRTADGEQPFNYNPNKYECFYTGAVGKDHYGIRTGFASSDIDYIVIEKYDERVALDIVMNGFYIPIVNKEGKILFTPQMYDDLKDKMMGLSYYGENGYNFSDNLVTDDTKKIASAVSNNIKFTKLKRNRIEDAIRDVLNEMGLTLKTKLDGDLTPKSVELIDTGSTSRGTNAIGDGDFDFMVRLDRTLITNHYALEEFKNKLITRFEQDGPILEKDITSSGDFRFKGVQLGDMKLDLDLSFTVKTDKILYSTDECLSDRLDTIRDMDPEKFNYVCANIILAKKVLKEAGCYKSSHSVPAQGGLGGVGIENWILQNGGSFEDAAISFLSAAEEKSFDEFVNTYQIFDFGENHFTAKNGEYAHDNFVRNNMNESGYKLMVETLKKYLNRTNQDISTDEIQIEEESVVRK